MRKLYLWQQMALRFIDDARAFVFAPWTIQQTRVHVLIYMCTWGFVQLSRLHAKEHARTYARTRMCTRKRTCTRSQICAHSHTQRAIARTRAHTHARTRAHARAREHTHTRAYALAHAYIHTHTHSHNTYVYTPTRATPHIVQDATGCDVTEAGR